MADDIVQFASGLTGRVLIRSNNRRLFPRGTRKADLLICLTGLFANIQMKATDPCPELTGST